MTSPQPIQPHEYPVSTTGTYELCRSCLAPMVFVRNPKSGKMIPLSLRTARLSGNEGPVALSHFRDCDDPKRHSRK